MVIARSLPTEPDMLAVELAALFHDLAGTPVADIPVDQLMRLKITGDRVKAYSRVDP